MKNRLTLLAMVVAAGCLLVDLKRLKFIFTSEYVFKMDFAQFFLMGKALRFGEYLYTPLPQLAKQFAPELLVTPLNHPSPYPPIAALVGAPFAYLPYKVGAGLWVGLELLWLALAIVLVVRHFKNAPTLVSVMAFLFVCWRPVYQDLLFGQISLLILFLLTGAWLAARSGRDIASGFLLGVILSLKLYAWPVVLFLIISQRWRVVLSAGVVFAVAQLATVVLFGPRVLVEYYLNVAPAVGEIWRSDIFNFSAFALGYRTLGEIGGVVLVVLVMAYAFVLAHRARDFDSKFIVMLSASTVLSPIAWIHYFVTLLPAVCLMASRRRLTRGEILIGTLVLIVLLPGIFPFSWPNAALWTALPFFGLLGLLWLISSSSQSTQEVTA